METVVVDSSCVLATHPLLPTTTFPFWGPVVAGAIVDCGDQFDVLLTFGSAIGLSVVSTSLSWRDVSWALLIVSGLFLVFVALASFGFGGYIAGRLRPRYAAIPADVSLRDGIAGLTTWALAVVLAAILAAGLAALSGSVVAASSTARLVGFGGRRHARPLNWIAFFSPTSMSAMRIGVIAAPKPRAS